MWPFGHTKDTSVSRRLNQLETDLAQLRLEATERQLAVLNACEKVMHQLEARTRKRARTIDDAADEEGLPRVPQDERSDETPHPNTRSFSTAHLSRRFRGGG